MSIDPVHLTAALVRCPSVTPDEGGALSLLAETLAPHGFRAERMDREGTPNLYLRRGESGPVFAFNGHTDVVPLGEESAWTVEPFGGEIIDGRVWGRGACDMKSGVAAFVAAAARLIEEHPEAPGSIVILITGDEEGPARDGTTAILDFLAARGETMDVCVVGEPTARERIGDTIKIGRRGSVTINITATGKQGHVAYPHLATDPMKPLMALLNRLAHWRIDEGTAHFDASTLAITTIDVGNPASNVIPARATARVNIRFNDSHDGAGIVARVDAMAQEAFEESAATVELNANISAESFLTPPGALSELVAAAAQDETGVTPDLTTGGGTSDARFVQAYCPVVEFGLTGATMHQIDEWADIEEIRVLERVYFNILKRFFGI